MSQSTEIFFKSTKSFTDVVAELADLLNIRFAPDEMPDGSQCQSFWLYPILIGVHAHQLKDTGGIKLSEYPYMVSITVDSGEERDTQHDREVLAQQVYQAMVDSNRYALLMTDDGQLEIARHELQYVN